MSQCIMVGNAGYCFQNTLDGAFTSCGTYYCCVDAPENGLNPFSGASPCSFFRCGAG